MCLEVFNKMYITLNKHEAISSLTYNLPLFYHIIVGACMMCLTNILAQQELHGYISSCKCNCITM